MSVTFRVIAGIGVVLFSKEVGVLVNVVGAQEIEIVVTPNPNAQPGQLYAVELSIDGLTQGARGLTWTAAEIASAISKIVMFTGADLNAVDRILVEVGLNTDRAVVTSLDLSTTTLVSGLMGIQLDAAPDGLAGYIAEATIRDPSIARFSDVVFPGAFTLATHDPDPVSGPVVEFRGVDLGSVIQAGAVDVLLASLQIDGLVPGSTVVDVKVTQFDDDGGFDIARVEIAGILTIT